MIEAKFGAILVTTNNHVSASDSFGSLLLFSLLLFHRICATCCELRTGYDNCMVSLFDFFSGVSRSCFSFARLARILVLMMVAFLIQGVLDVFF